VPGKFPFVAAMKILSQYRYVARVNWKLINRAAGTQGKRIKPCKKTRNRASISSMQARGQI
jgi:hypothetical protein